MGIGRIAALLGVSPNAATESVPPETAKDEGGIAPAADARADQQFRDRDGSNAAAQIEAVIGAIRQSGESAGQDGAGMAFSQSGSQYRDSVAALSHLIQGARDSGAALPPPLLGDAVSVLSDVESRIENVRTTVQDRLVRMDSANAERVRQTTGAFIAEMQAAAYNLRAVLGNMPGVTVPGSQPQQTQR